MRFCMQASSGQVHSAAMTYNCQNFACSLCTCLSSNVSCISGICLHMTPQPDSHKAPADQKDSAAAQWHWSSAGCPGGCNAGVGSGSAP